MTKARSSYNHARIAQDALETYPCPDKGNGLGRSTDDVDSVCVDGSASRGYTVPNDRECHRDRMSQCQGTSGNFEVNTTLGEVIEKRTVTLKQKSG